MDRYANGDDIDLARAITSGGVAVDLTGAAVEVALVKDDHLSLGLAAVDATIVSAAAGTITAAFPADTTTELAPGRYYAEAQVTKAGKVRTYILDPPIEVFKGIIP